MLKVESSKLKAALGFQLSTFGCFPAHLRQSTHVSDTPSASAPNTTSGSRNRVTTKLSSAASGPPMPAAAPRAATTPRPRTMYSAPKNVARLPASGRSGRAPGATSAASAMTTPQIRWSLNRNSRSFGSGSPPGCLATRRDSAPLAAGAAGDGPRRDAEAQRRQHRLAPAGAVEGEQQPQGRGHQRDRRHGTQEGEAD